MPCAHCHARHPSVALYRIVGVGQRYLCEACFTALDRLGMNLRRTA